MLDRFEKFTFTIFDIQRCWNRIAAEEMQAYGLKGSYAIYLIAMHRCPEGMTAVQLGTLCGRDKADVSRAVSMMEKKGLLKKETDSGSQYRAKLFLTDQGAKITDSIVKKAETAQAIAGEGLTDEQRRIFYEALASIDENLRKLCKIGIPEQAEDIAV